jgi:hypothetical protein
MNRSSPYRTVFEVLCELSTAQSSAELLAALQHPKLPRSVRELLRFAHTRRELER